MRKVGEGDIGPVAAALARAFYDDPPTAWVVNDDARRERLLERSFKLYLRKLWLGQDECYTTQAIAEAAVWERPGEWKVPVLAQLLLLPSMARIYGRILPRVLRAIAALESSHPSEPHYYLLFLGVEPEWQGRGLGSALMRPVLDRCDGERIPAYLEASTPRNRMLYERHGFAVTEEFHVGKGSPPVWRMWRDPPG